MCGTVADRATTRQYSLPWGLPDPVRVPCALARNRRRRWAAPGQCAGHGSVGCAEHPPATVKKTSWGRYGRLALGRRCSP